MIRRDDGGDWIIIEHAPHSQTTRLSSHVAEGRTMGLIRQNAVPILHV
jgi:hypothetical protein